MRAVSDPDDRSGEILDLTAPAKDARNGIVARWLREALARDARKAAHRDRHRDRHGDRHRGRDADQHGDRREEEPPPT